MDEFERNERLARSYLLGELAEAEREQFEERFFHDPGFNEVARLIEDELIEDYVAGMLAAEARGKFVKHYLTTPHQLRKLEMTEALKEYAGRRAFTHPGHMPARPRETFASQLLKQWRGRNRLFRFAAATASAVALCVLLVGGVILWQYISRVTVLRRLKDMNTANALSGVNSAQIFNVTLSPERARGGAAAGPEVVVPSNASVVRLTLTSVPEGHSTFDVEVRALDGRDVFIVPSVRAEGSTRRVSVNIPPELLGRGDYLLKLLARSASGEVQEVADYFLRIARA